MPNLRIWSFDDLDFLISVNDHRLSPFSQTVNKQSTQIFVVHCSLNGSIKRWLDRHENALLNLSHYHVEFTTLSLLSTAKTSVPGAVLLKSYDSVRFMTCVNS